MARVKQARFPVIAANWTDDDTGDPVVKPYIVKDVGGVKVGIVGMASPVDRQDRRQESHRGLELRDQGTRGPGARPGASREGEGRSRPSSSPHGAPHRHEVRFPRPGIDAVPGRTRTTSSRSPSRSAGRWVCQAGSHGKNLGRLDLTVRNGKVVKHDHEVYRIAAKEIKADPEIQKIIDAGYAPYIEKLSRDRTDEDDDLAARDLAEPDGQLHQ